MKDKIKPVKPIEDNTSIVKPSPPQNVIFNWRICIICGQDLRKKPKQRVINGISFTSMASKKYYSLCNKKICWNCVFNLVKKFKNEGKE